MTTITMTSITRTYKNAGHHAEQALAYTLTHEMRKHDHVAFDEGSDIPEYSMSVKSERFTLASGNLFTAQDKEGQIAEYIARTHSKSVAYVVNDFSMAYVMDMVEFEEFLHKFCGFSRDSEENGGKYKVRANSESKAMLRWFAEKLAM